MKRTCGDLARWLGLAVLALSLQAGAAQDGHHEGAGFGTGVTVDQEWTSRMHFSGYGELHVNFPKTGTMDSDAPSRSEIHRFTLGWGYDWTDSIRFAAEVDFEHNASELEFEFGYIEFDVAPDLSIRAGSVLMQVGYFRLTKAPGAMEGKRLFRCAPLHHHFHLSGWAESKVVVRLWVLGVLFAAVALATLKLR